MPEIFYGQPGYASAEDSEEQAWEVFRPVVETRIERGFNERAGTENYTCGSLHCREYADKNTVKINNKSC